MSCNDVSTINYTATSQINPVCYATNTVIAGTNVVIASGKAVEFLAGSKIQLLNGFSAKSGCTFYAKLVPCTNTTNTTNTSKSAEMDTLVGKVVTDVQETNKGSDIKIYPNPTTGMLTIETGTDKASFSIFNMFGSLVKQQQLYGSINHSDISNLMPGTYIMKVVIDNGQQKVQLVIKR